MANERQFTIPRIPTILENSPSFGIERHDTSWSEVVMLVTIDPSLCNNLDDSDERDAHTDASCVVD